MEALAAMPRYEAYKDSGVDWLGEIPEQWSVRKISHVFRSIGSGTTPSSSNRSYYDGEVAWVQTGDLNNAVLKKTNKNITYKALKHLSSLKVYQANSLIIALYGATIGKVSILGLPAATNQACCVISNPLNADIRFTFYLFMGVKRDLISMAYGGGQPNISQDLIKNLRLPFPDSYQQVLIANFLDKKTAQIDEAIAIKEKQIELLKERKQIIIQKAVTQGLDPNVPMKDSRVDWIGEIPEHWEVKRLKFVLEERSERSKTGEEPLFMVSQIHGLVVRADYHDKAVVAASSIDNKVVYENDLVFNKLKAHLGVFFKSNIEFKGLVSPDYAVYRCKAHIVDAKYLELLFRHPSYIGQFIIRATGIVEGLVRLYTGDLFDIQVPIAPPREQLAILAHIDAQSQAFESAIDIQQNQIQKLKEYKTTLINSAVTGKIKVPSSVAAGVST